MKQSAPNGGPKSMLFHMKRLIEMFSERVEDRSTLDELHQMIGEPNSWHKAHDLFSRIRKKTLEVVRKKDTRSSKQYSFEEICAKSIFNLTDSNAPFDVDSPYWVVPHALRLARQLGIDESAITTIVTE
jgi:hypothetical protein